MADAAVESPTEGAGQDLKRPFDLLAEMTQDFADSYDIETTLERALATICRQLGAEAGSLWLLGEAGDSVICHASVGPRSIVGARLAVTQGIVGRSVRRNLSQRVLDVATDPEFSPAIDQQSGFETRSILCAPMSVKDRPLGAIELVNKRGGDGRFAAADLRLLHALASSAALAIANARMAATLAEHERVRRELELAAEIQRSLLPAPLPPPFPLFGVNVPARAVSGDFFDILGLPDGRIAFCLGDVSGKGMNAALMMAKTASLYRCLAKSVEGPGRILGLLNEELCETSTRGMFVTMVAGTLDPDRRTVCIANAGHEPPLCRSMAGEFTSLPADVPPLGITRDLAPQGDVPAAEVSLGGGALYLFSDGLTEACSGEGPVGAEGLRRMIVRFADRPLDQRVRAIIEEVSRLELRDDLTLLAVSLEGAGG